MLIPRKLAVSFDFLAFFWCVVSLLVLPARGQSLAERLSVQGEKLVALQRLVETIEVMKIGESLAEMRIEFRAMKEAIETREKATYGLYIPVGLLALSKILEFFKPKRMPE